MTATTKLVAGLLALALVRPWGRHVPDRMLKRAYTFDGIVLSEEEHFRTFTRVAMDTWLRSHRNGDDAPVVREGRRMRWLETVLAPLDELPPERKRLLQTALALTLGAEAIITMKDVCRLDNDETLAVLRWAATALLHAALQDAPGSDPDQPSRPERNGQTPS